MTESAKQLLDRFKLGNAPSLPAVLLKGLTISNGILSGRDTAPVETLKDFLRLDPLLFAKVIDLARRKGIDSLDPDALVEALGTAEILEVLSRTALQSGLAPDGDEQRFLKECWRQSMLASLLVREIALIAGLDERECETLALSARYLNIGEVVFENIFSGLYRRLQENNSWKISRAELLAAETRQFGCNHAELGGETLKRWGFSQFNCDAVKYQYEALDQILDASATVRICWLARQLADKREPGPELILAARTLFGIDAGALGEIQRTASKGLEDLAREAGLTFGPEAASAEDKARHELAERMRNLSLFSGSRTFSQKPEPRDVEAVTKAFSAVLAELFNHCPGIVFAPDRGRQFLQVWTSNLGGAPLGEIKIRCNGSSSLIAEALTKGHEVHSEQRQAEMTVIDRQILSILDAPAFLCEPLRADGKAVGVLVLGLTAYQQELYLKDDHLRSMLKHMLASELRHSTDTAAGKQDSVLEQKVKEAVHEASNPLSIIKNYLQLLSLKEEEDPQTREQLSIIGQEIDRVRDILDRLRGQPGRWQEAAEEEVDLNAVISDLNKMLVPSILQEKCIELKLDLDETLPRIKTRGNAVKQILTNLLKNSVEASDANGEIVIKTRNNIHFNSRYYVQIVISDNGPGIEKEVMQRLYVSGMTTKGGTHTGSGLAIVKKLMEELGGEISCQSDGKGTCFTLLLPRPDLGRQRQASTGGAV